MLKITVEPVPTWALNYLVNGDTTLLSEEDVDMIEKWCKSLHVELVDPQMNEEGSTHPYFTWYPAFGLPGEVEDCNVLYREQETEAVS